jgi:peptide/nickel transport system substrate-binding protein
LALLALATCAALVVSACSGNAGPQSSGNNANEPTKVTIGLQGVTQTWDPAKFGWGYYLQPLQAVYASLLIQAADGSFMPGLATEWGYNSATEFRMKLREGVKFTDGTDFNAEAVKANLEHDLATPGQYTSQLATLESVETPGAYEVVLHLSAPNPSLETVFAASLGMIASPAAIEQEGTLDGEPVGAGPYKIDQANTVIDDHYTFVKNPDYWDASNIAFDQIVFRILLDPNALFTALEAGEIDMAPGMATTADAAKADNINVLEYESITYSIFLADRDGTLAKPLADPKVRQALNYAVDRQAIAESIKPGRPTDQMFGPVTEAYDPALDDFYAYDPDKARALLEEAGFGDGFEFTVLSTPSEDTHAQAIAANFQAVGVNMVLDSKSPTDYASAKFSGQYPAFMSANTPVNAYLDAASWLLRDSPQNPFKTNDDLFQSLWETAAAQTDATERKATFEELSKAVVESGWFLPTVQGRSYWYSTSKVKGVEIALGQAMPFIYTWAPA